MVDLSINYCFDLRSLGARGGSLDRKLSTSNSATNINFTALMSSARDVPDKKDSDQSDATMVAPDEGQADVDALETTNFLYRPSCPPAFRVNDYDALSEGDKAEDDDDDDEEEEDNKHDDDEDDEEDDDEDEYEYVDEEVEEEAEAGTETAGGDQQPPKKKISIRRKNFSASRSPAPERVDGAQAEKDAEVEISEVIALRYQHNPSIFFRDPSILVRGPHSPSSAGSATNSGAGSPSSTAAMHAHNARAYSAAQLLFVQQPSVMEDDEQPQLSDTPPSPFPRPSSAEQQEAEAEEHQMMKRFLDPLCTIGTGAFGRVQLCQHRQNGKYYALKSMYMPTIIERRQVEHVHQEKRILQNLEHPFIVRLYDTAKDRANLYMVMEFLPGGELFAYFRALRKFSSTVVKFYSAEIILAIEYLHSKQIAYRDLKPENLMVSIHGHIKLTDFGFAKIIHNKSYTLCGTPSYLAPEVFERRGHNQSVDYWALGVLIYELMAGDQPFWGKCPEDVYEHILESKENGLRFPRRTFSPNAKDIIRGLLCIEPKQRLGCKALKCHPWFAPYDWNDLYNRNYKPPFVPTIYHEGDTGNFDSYQEVEHMAPAKQSELDLFDEW